MNYKDKWYYSTIVIAICFLLSWFIIPLVIGIILLVKQIKSRKKDYIALGLPSLTTIESKVSSLTSQSNTLHEQIEIMEKQKRTTIDEISDLSNKINLLQEQHKKALAGKDEDVSLLNKIAKEREEIDALKQQNDALKQTISENQEKVDLISMTNEEITKNEQLLSELKGEVIETSDEALYQSFGFYEPKYNFENSEEYQAKLKDIRQEQKELVKLKLATTYSENWTLDGSIQKGRAMTNDNIRLAIRAFNCECDSAIAKVKFNNVASCEKKINAAFKAINKANVRNLIEIKDEYRALKYDELYLAYEYEQKKEEEKQEQRELRERMREEAKVQREIEREKQKIEKEQQHFSNELNRLKDEVAEADDESKLSLLNKIEEIKNDIEALERDKKDVFNREQNTRAGYVYIISNIGSFGEDIYKIGLTRRLDPTERVRELGDASVPFPFDIHATIFSDDAPTLETALHRTFDDRRLNKVNNRKEFFRVSLGEIKAVVEKNHNKTVEYTKLAEAQEYRKSLAIEKKENPVAS